jgi:hypothetical protein
VKFYQAIEDGGLKPAMREIVYPIILVVLLSNGGDNMRTLTLATRDVMNNVNSAANSVIDADVSIRSAMAQATRAELVEVSYRLPKP